MKFNVFTTLVSVESPLADKFSFALGDYTIMSLPNYIGDPPSPEVRAFHRIGAMSRIDENLGWMKLGANPDMLRDIIASWSKIDPRSMIFWGSIILVDMEAPDTFTKLRTVLAEVVRISMPVVVAGNSTNRTFSLHNPLKLSDRIPVVYYDADDPESVKKVYLTLLRQVRPTEKLQQVIDYFETL